ncbi:MAG: ABC transporter substrate-binding protein [Pseudomonadota bacterium]
MRAALGLALGGSLWIASADAAGEIHVLNWQGYGTDEAWAIEMFEKQTGIKVVHDYFNSEQEMLTKLRTSPGAYDVVLINSTYTEQAAKEGLLQPIATAKIAHFGDLIASMRDSPYLNIDGKTYGVAWVWGMTGLAYNVKDLPQAPDSIEVLWDPKLAGRISLRDDAVEVVSFAAIATGQDMNNPADMAKIREKLEALKPQIATFWSSEDEWNKYMQADQFDIAVYWSGSAARSKKAFGLPVEFVVPKEGAIGWFDGLSIATGAPNPEMAHAFIDYMVDPDFYVPWDNNVGAPASANGKANAELPQDALNRAVLGNPEVAKRLQFQAPIPDERKQEWLDLWQEVKTKIAL